MAVDWAAGMELDGPARENTLDGAGTASSSRASRFAAAFAANPAAMAIVEVPASGVGTLVEVNGAFCSLVGYERPALLGTETPRLFAPEDGGGDPVADPATFTEPRRVVRCRGGDGRTLVAEVSTAIVEGPDPTCESYVLVARDVGGEENLVAQLAYQAFHDPLTGLANRILFEDRLSHALTRATRTDSVRGAIMLLDLDDFKGVNDTLGHHVGDELLVALAERLGGATRTSDTLCRFGGDEFLLLVEGLDEEEKVEDVAKRLLGALAEPFQVGGTSVSQQASLGIVPWSRGDEDPNSLFARADTAMYEAKRLGKGRHVVFDPEVHERTVRRFELARDLRVALAAGELSMHYQPLVELDSCEIEGFEALMRWSHPSQGAVPPDLFIPLAEESDLIFELGAFALREATRQAMAWTALGERPRYVAVNLSARQLYDPNIVRVVEDALTRSGLPATRLVLEVTESAALGDLEASRHTMQRLVQLGIRVAIDDFGTGYSSLSYLSLTYPKVIKIDRSLIGGCDQAPDRRTLLEGVVSLGHSLGATVVAEGVETAGHLECLRKAGCDVGQGYYFSAAVPATDVVATARRIQRDLTRSWEAPARTVEPGVP